MKYLLFALAFSTTIYAQTMSNSEHLDIHSKSSSHTDQNKTHQLHQIDEKQAMSIAQKQCKDGPIKLTLKHHDLYLYYIATTPTCKVYINTLNGEVMAPKDIKRKK